MPVGGDLFFHLQAALPGIHGRSRLSINNHTELLYWKHLLDALTSIPMQLYEVVPPLHT